MPAQTAQDGNEPNDNLNGVPPKQDSLAWGDFAKRLWEHDKTTVEAWKEEIDTLLVFVGACLPDPNDSR